MKLVYLDESGLGPIGVEPYLVEAGVMIDDRQLARVKRRIQELVDKYVPEAHRPGFFVHAKHLFHGCKVFRQRLSPSLWIADSCAFSLRRLFAGAEDALRSCRAFAPQIAAPCRQILPDELAGLLPL